MPDKETHAIIDQLPSKEFRDYLLVKYGEKNISRWAILSQYVFHRDIGKIHHIFHEKETPVTLKILGELIEEGIYSLEIENHWTQQ